MADKTIKGLTVEIGGDTTKLGTAIDEADRKSRVLSSELGRINNLLKFDDANPALLAQKQQVLNEQITSTSEKLSMLREAEAQVQEQFARGENVSQEQMRALQREIIATENKLGTYRTAAEETAAQIENLGRSSEESAEVSRTLAETVREQQTALDDLKSQYIEAAAAKGTDSDEARKLAGQITELSSELRENEAKLSAAKEAAERLGETAEPVIEQEKTLSETVKDQKKALSDLKDKYADVAAAQGKDSDEAQALAAQIASLSDELHDNETRLADAQYQSDDLSDSMDDLGDSAEDAGDSFSTAAVAVGTFIGGLALDVLESTVGMLRDMTSAVIEQIGATAEYGDSIDKMSQKLGMSAEAYQEWDFIMQHSGSDIDKMTTSAKKLAEAVAEPTDAATAAFEKLGISITDAANMSQEELFEATITALQGMESGAERTALANDLLGRSAMDLGALLNTSVEETEEMRQQVHALGGVMSDDAVKASAAYQDSLQNLQTSISGTARGFVSELLPSLSTVMDGLSALLSGDISGIDQLREGVEDAVEQIPDIISEIIGRAEEIIPQLVELVSDVLPQVTEQIMPLLSDLLDFILQSLNDLLPLVLETASRILLSLVSAISGSAPGILRAIMQSASAILDALASVLPDLLTQLVTDLIPSLIDNFFTYLPDVVDALMQLVTAIGDAIPGMIEQLTAYLPEIIDTILSGIMLSIPSVLRAAVSLFGAILNAIPVLLRGLADALPLIIESITDWLTDSIPELLECVMLLIDTIAESLPEIIGTLIAVLPDLIDGIIGALLSMLPLLIDCGITLFVSLVQALPAIITQICAVLPQLINGIVTALIGMLPQLIQCGITLLVSLVQALPTIIQTICAALPQIISAVIGALYSMIPLLVDCGIQLFLALIEAMPEIINSIMLAMPDIIDSIIRALNSMIPELIACGFALFVSLIQNLGAAIVRIVSAVPQIVNAIKNAFVSRFSVIRDVGRNLIEGLWNGIQDMASWIHSKITGFGEGILDSLKNFFGIASPSRVFREQIGKNLALGLAAGIEDEAGAAVDAAQQMADDISDVEFRPRKLDFSTIGGTTAEENPVVFERNLQAQWNASMPEQQTVFFDPSLLSRLDNILAAIEHGQVLMLDSDALVGGTAHLMDDALGKIEMMARRR